MTKQKKDKPCDLPLTLNSLCKYFSKSHSLDQLTERIQNTIHQLGFTHFLFLRLERMWRENSHYGILHSMPDELIREYQENRYHESDLLIAFGRYNTHTIFSSQVYHYIGDAPFEIHLTKHNRQLMLLYKRFGFFDHYAIPMPAINGSGHVLLLLTSMNTTTKRFQEMILPHLSACRHLCKAIDSVTTEKFHSSFIDAKEIPVDITPKVLLTLQRLANNDIIIAELAADMAISPITAHQHLGAARKALGAQTNIGAIIKGIQHGLIHIH